MNFPDWSESVKAATGDDPSYYPDSEDDTAEIDDGSIGLNRMDGPNNGNSADELNNNEIQALEKRKLSIKEERIGAKNALKQQATKMLEISKKK